MLMLTQRSQTFQTQNLFQDPIADSSSVHHTPDKARGRAVIRRGGGSGASASRSFFLLFGLNERNDVIGEK